MSGKGVRTPSARSNRRMRKRNRKAAREGLVTPLEPDVAISQAIERLRLADNERRVQRQRNGEM